MPKRGSPVQQASSLHIGRTAFLALALLVPLVYHSGLYDFALLPKRLLVQMGLVVVSLFWVADLRADRMAFKPSALYLPLACYLFWSLLALLQSANPFSGLVVMGHQIAFICLFVLAYHAFPLEALPAFLRIGAGVGLLVSAIGILEARGVHAAWLPLSNGRPSATFAYRNFAAAFLIMNIPLALTLWLRARKKRDAILGIAAAAAMLVFLVYTRTRGAWAGFAGATLTICILYFVARYLWKIPSAFSEAIGHPSAKIAAVAAFLCAIGLALLPPHIAARQSRAIDEHKVALLDALSAGPQADRGRLVMWRHTLDMIRDHPLFGVGPGNWRYAYPPYDGGDMVHADTAPERPHNDLLSIASETGIPGLLCYLWFLIALTGLVFRTLKRSSSADRVVYTLAFSASLLAMLGHGMVSFPQERAATSWLFWFGLGILAQFAQAPSATPQKHTAIARSAALLIPLLLVGCTWLTYRQIQFDRHFLNAREYDLSGDQNAVLGEATSAITWGPFNPDIFLLQGNAYQAVGLLPQAEAAYEKGLTYHPHSIQLQGALGTVFAMENRFDASQKMYEQALAIYPGYYQMYNNLGGVFQKRGDLPRAIACYRQALKQNSSYLDAYSNLGLAYVAADSAEKAIATYREALRIAPNDPALYHDLGEAYYKYAQKDPRALLAAQKAFEYFLKTWRGAPGETQHARQRLEDIRARLAASQP